MERELDDLDSPSTAGPASSGAASAAGTKADTGGGSSDRRPAGRPRDRARSRERGRRRAEGGGDGGGRRVVVVGRVAETGQTEKTKESSETTDVSAVRPTSSVFSRLGAGKSQNKPSTSDSGGGRRKLKLKRGTRDGATDAGGRAATAATAPDPLESHLRKIRARNAAIVRRTQEVAKDKHLYG
ncbi:uncharacterized protein LOC122383788 [Amphibalanus amphitrite]|uniref:uncharacterized protein LOC122383788 n=1 Tax=Amphibalanus amphitrite TaxID=1232801 RepID=UPI001C8FC792|nr:uncharacterized protein LOC122383788 [Amphibalanus amphitrite]